MNARRSLFRFGHHADFLPSMNANADIGKDVIPVAILVRDFSKSIDSARGAKNDVPSFGLPGVGVSRNWKTRVAASPPLVTVCRMAARLLTGRAMLMSEANRRPRPRVRICRQNIMRGESKDDYENHQSRKLPKRDQTSAHISQSLATGLGALCDIPIEPTAVIWLGRVSRDQPMLARQAHQTGRGSIGSGNQSGTTFEESLDYGVTNHPCNGRHEDEAEAQGRLINRANPSRPRFCRLAENTLHVSLNPVQQCREILGQQRGNLFARGRIDSRSPKIELFSEDVSLKPRLRIECGSH